jgi:hypothetical protein
MNLYFNNDILVLILIYFFDCFIKYDVIKPIIKLNQNNNPLDIFIYILYKKIDIAFIK